MVKILIASSLILVLLLAGCASSTADHFQAGLDHVDFIDSYGSSNPVIACGATSAFDQCIREIGNILYEPSDTGKEYKIFYSGYVPPYTENKSTIGYAYSSDSKSWTKAGQVINDAGGREDPYVVKSGSTYYLYCEDNTNLAIRRYHSSDCTAWTDDGVVFSKNGAGWEYYQVASPIVWIEGSTWYLLYEGLDGVAASIGLATSNNGTAWTREPTNPVLDPSSANLKFDKDEVCSDDIVKIDSTYYMTYHGYGNWGGSSIWRSGIATSANLISWTRDDNPILYSDGTTNRATLMVCNVNGMYIFYHCYGDTTDTSGIYRSYAMQAQH